MMDNNFVKGLLVGVVLGAAGSIFFMSEPGRKVAGNIKKKASEIASKVTSKSRELGEIEEEAVDFIGSLIDRGKITRAEAVRLKKHLVEFIKD